MWKNNKLTGLRCPYCTQKILFFNMVLLLSARNIQCNSCKKKILVYERLTKKYNWIRHITIFLAGGIVGFYKPWAIEGSITISIICILFIIVMLYSKLLFIKLTKDGEQP